MHEDDRRDAPHHDGHDFRDEAPSLGPRAGGEQEKDRRRHRQKAEMLINS
ncbi:hypothetical protein [Rubrimonas cliftonensis]|nr:hypothetical protein [Rubrimonas cliftonensis]